MKSSEGNLRYPNMLNEQYESFRSTLESADAAPTRPDYTVFDELHGRLQAQLATWNRIASTDVPALNELVKEQNIVLVAVPSGK
jgi:hypothetical protein